jgi:hypothetical protein
MTARRRGQPVGTRASRGASLTSAHRCVRVLSGPARMQPVPGLAPTSVATAFRATVACRATIRYARPSPSARKAWYSKPTSSTPSRMQRSGAIDRGQETAARPTSGFSGLSGTPGSHAWQPVAGVTAEHVQQTAGSVLAPPEECPPSGWPAALAAGKGSMGTHP